MGKSTVSKMFRALKIPVFDSDKKVKEILDKNHQVIEQISKIWPDSIIENKKQKSPGGMGEAETFRLDVC